MEFSNMDFQRAPEHLKQRVAHDGRPVRGWDGSKDISVNSSVLAQVLLFSLVLLSSHLGLNALTRLTCRRWQGWHRTASCNHCHSFSTGWTLALFQALVQAGTELEKVRPSWSIALFVHWKMSKGRGPKGSREVNKAPPHDHLLSLTWCCKQKCYLYEWTSGDLGRLPVATFILLLSLTGDGP